MEIIIGLIVIAALLWAVHQIREMIAHISDLREDITELQEKVSQLVTKLSEIAQAVGETDATADSSPEDTEASNQAITDISTLADEAGEISDDNGIIEYFPPQPGDDQKKV